METASSPAPPLALLLKHAVAMPSIVPLPPLARGLSRLGLGPGSRVYFLDGGLGTADLVAEVCRHVGAEIRVDLVIPPEMEPLRAGLEARLAHVHAERETSVTVAPILPPKRSSLGTRGMPEVQLHPPPCDAALSFTVYVLFGGVPGLLGRLGPSVRPGGWLFLAEPLPPPNTQPEWIAQRKAVITSVAQSVGVTLVDEWSSTRDDYVGFIETSLARMNAFIEENKDAPEARSYLAQLEAAREHYEIPGPEDPVPAYEFFLFRRDEEGSRT